MIAREQARVWGGPDAAAVGDMVCLNLIQGDELLLGSKTQLLIGRAVYSGYDFCCNSISYGKLNEKLS